MEDFWERFSIASRGLVEALYDGREPTAGDVSVVRDVLHRFLGRLGLSPDAREDIIQETLVLLISGVRRRLVDRDGNLAAYVRRIAINCSYDAGRYRSRRPVVVTDHVPQPLADDGIAVLLDRLASAEIVTRAMTLAYEQGDDELALFASDWLTIAERLQKEPSLRDVAEQTGISHVQVARLLERFRRYLQAAADPEPPA